MKPLFKGTVYQNSRRYLDRFQKSKGKSRGKKKETSSLNESLSMSHNESVGFIVGERFGHQQSIDSNANSPSFLDPLLTTSIDSVNNPGTHSMQTGQ